MRTLMALREYLECSSLEENLNLDKDGILKYHWSNHREAREFQRHHYLDNPRPRARLLRLDAGLDCLKDDAVWLSSKLGQLKLNLYTLYNQFSDINIRGRMMAEDQLLISTVAQSGPYVPLSSMRWFDPNIYRKFILRRILMGHVPVRDFRMQTNLPAQMMFDGEAIRPYSVHLHQLTQHGIVLQISNPVAILRLKEKQNFTLCLSWGELLKLAKISSTDMLDQLKTLSIKPVFSHAYMVNWKKSGPVLADFCAEAQTLFIPYSSLVSVDQVGEIMQTNGQYQTDWEATDTIVQFLGRIKDAMEKTVNFAA